MKNSEEELYHKKLLMDKIKHCLNLVNKSYIFNQGYCWDLLFKDKDASILSFLYAYDILEGPFPEGEKYIATDGFCSYEYARHVLKGPFPLGEKAIAKDAHYSYSYARYVLEGPFPEGEKAIATNDVYSFYYAKHVLKGPFPLGETVINNSSIIQSKYARFLYSYKEKQRKEKTINRYYVLKNKDNLM